MVERQSEESILQDGDAAASAGLKWVGHPLVDMGTAILAAFAERDLPEQVTIDDLERFAEYAGVALFTKTVRSHVSVVFTSNAPYMQASFSEDVRRQKADGLLRAFRSTPADDAACSYCGRPAARVGTATGRAYREMIPMVTGQGVVNFFPGGEHGLWLCGTCTTALQALAIGAPSCEGRALVVAADEPSLLVAIVRGWLPAIRRRIQLSESSGDKLEGWKAPRTRLVDRLREMEDREIPSTGLVGGLTVFHLSNSGQGPSIAIYHLPASVVRFVRRAHAQAYREAWTRVQRRAWVDAKRKPAERDPTADERPVWRNRFYEALFGLPTDAPQFVRRYFLSHQRASMRTPVTGDPTALWALVGLFLREVMGMEEVRIEAIRTLGDALAEEIASQERRLFRRASLARGYADIRRLLLRVSSGRLQRGLAPLLDFDGFLTVFEVGDEVPRADWRLAWDLVLVRVIDELHRRELFKRDTALAQELADATAAEAEPEDEAIPSGA